MIEKLIKTVQNLDKKDSHKDNLDHFKSIKSFLVKLSVLIPDQVLFNFSKIVVLLQSDFYILR